MNGETRMVISRGKRKRSAVAPTLWSTRGRVNNYGTTLALLLVTVGATHRVAAAQTAVADSVRVRELGPGATFRRITRPAGPWVLSVLEIDLRRPELVVRGVRACDRLLGRERPSAVARRLREEGINVVGVLNADFFDLRGGTGATENNVIIDGQIVKAVTATESPFDEFDNVHTQFGVTMAGAPVLDRFQLKGVVRTPSGEWPLAAVNARVANGLAVLTPWLDSAAMAADSTRSAYSIAHVTLLKVGGRADTGRYRVESTAVRGPAAVSSPQMAVLVASGAALPIVERLRVRDRVDIVARFVPDRGVLRTLVGGWPRIVDAGRNVALEADSVEGTIPRFSRARHPRSALGISRDSATLYLVAVDGRQEASVGMTLEELADAMIALGAFEAMNFDGGGSTALVVRDAVVNVPSDTSGERAVGNVIVVERRASGRPVPERRAVPKAPGSVSSCVLPARRDTTTVRRP
jgi:Phosphodiester glycosidase